jgi:hypothetical protein
VPSARCASRGIAHPGDPDPAVDHDACSVRDRDPEPQDHAGRSR